jgi:HD-GYP domain-containing protein (c-di-GMP phosphodiesterase class II)
MTARFDNLIMLLSAGISQRRMYAATHPKIVACSEDLARRLAEVLHIGSQESFFIGVADGKLVYRGRYLVGSTIVGRKLITFAENLRCGGFLFRAGADAHELRAFFSLAADLNEPAAGLTEARALLTSRAVRHVELSPPYKDAGWFGQSVAQGDGAWGSDTLDATQMEPLLRTYQSLFHTVETALGQAHGGSDVDVDGARSVSDQMVQATQGSFMDFMQIVRYPDYDSYTVGHSVRVAMIAVLVGHRLGLQPGALTELGTAGLLHDVGKARVPTEILYRPARLEESERRVIMEHAAAGALILLESRNAGLLAISAAWGHHLRHDGKGYPARPAWAARGNLTELLHLCDVFEALTAVRPYKAAHSPRRAYELMLEDPGEFDPRLLAAFADAMGFYPPGSRVLLSTGQQAVVVSAGRDLDRPQVRLTHDDEGELLAPAAREVVDLGDAGARQTSIARLLQDGIGPEPLPEAAPPPGAEPAMAAIEP